MHGKEPSVPAVVICESTIGEVKQLGLNTNRGKFCFRVGGVTKHETFIGKDKQVEVLASCPTSYVIFLP